MKKNPIIPLMALLALSVGTTTKCLAESLEGAVTAALKDSAAVDQALSRARSAAEEINIAKSRLRPNVSLEAAAGPAYRDRSIDGVSAGTGEALFSRRATVSVSQMLFDWGASGRFMRSARLRELYERILIADVREEQGLLVAETYVGLLAARMKANLIVSKLEYLGRLGELADKRKKGDGDTQYALLLGRQGTAEADLEKAKGQVEALERRFELLTQLKPSGFSFPRLPDVGGSFVDMDVAPRVLAARNAAEAQAEQVEALRKDLLPTVGLELRAGAGESVLGIQGPDNELSALAVVRWNPFDGGRKRALIRQAEAALAEDQAVMKDIKLAINDKVSTAQSEFKAAAKRYTELAGTIKEMDGAVVKFDALLDQEQAGATPISVAAVYGERNGAQLDAVDAWAERYQSAYRVLAVAGQLLDFLGVGGGLGVPASGDGATLAVQPAR
jgi:outer membrane protein